MDDAKKIFSLHEKDGFYRALGSLDCSGWKLNCSAVAEQHRTIENYGVPEYRLETWCDESIWIWNLKFCFPGAMNDINILNASLLFSNVRAGKWPAYQTSKFIGSRTINCCYWVVDGIYPAYRILLKKIPSPTKKRESVFSKVQEAFRKGAERVYGVLFSRWHILSIPYRLWNRKDMNQVVRCCVILHSMIVEARKINESMRTVKIFSFDPSAEVVPVRDSVPPENQYEVAEFYREIAEKVDDKRDHEMLTNALVEAIWNRYGEASTE